MSAIQMKASKLPKSVRMAPPIRGTSALIERPPPRNGQLHEPISPASSSTALVSRIASDAAKAQRILQPAIPPVRWHDSSMPMAGRMVMQTRMLDVISGVDRYTVDLADVQQPPHSSTGRRELRHSSFRKHKKHSDVTLPKHEQQQHQERQGQQQQRHTGQQDAAPPSQLPAALRWDALPAAQTRQVAAPAPLVASTFTPATPAFKLQEHAAVSQTHPAETQPQVISSWPAAPDIAAPTQCAPVAVQFAAPTVPFPAVAVDGRERLHAVVLQSSDPQAAYQPAVSAAATTLFGASIQVAPTMEALLPVSPPTRSDATQHMTQQHPAPPSPTTASASNDSPPSSDVGAPGVFGAPPPALVPKVRLYTPPQPSPAQRRQFRRAATPAGTAPRQTTGAAPASAELLATAQSPSSATLPATAQSPVSAQLPGASQPRTIRRQQGKATAQSGAKRSEQGIAPAQPGTTRPKQGSASVQPSAIWPEQGSDTAKVSAATERDRQPSPKTSGTAATAAASTLPVGAAHAAAPVPGQPTRRQMRKERDRNAFFRRASLPLKTTMPLIILNPPPRPKLRLIKSNWRGALKLSGARPRNITGPLIRDVYSCTFDALPGVVAKASTIVLNMAITALGNSRRTQQLQAMLALMMQLERCNEHTHASAFVAFHRARRPDLVMMHFDTLCRHHVDMGPVAASALIKLCAGERDLPLALEVFQRLVAARTTLNRWTYNCLAHLCGVMGKLPELQAVFTMMRKDPDPGNRPDAFTYDAIIRCITATKRWDLLTRVYDQMVAEQVAVSPEVWCHLITAAARGGKPALAQSLFDACVKSGMEPSQQIYNALLSALSKTASFENMLILYRRMIASEAAPDSYTFNALLTACARVGCRASVVEELVVETRRWGVRLNTHLGTSLVNAYKHSPEMTSGEPVHVARILDLADDLLGQLCAARLVNSYLFTSVASLHAQAGDKDGMFRIVHEMQRTGMPFECITFQLLSRACSEGGLDHESQMFALESTKLSRAKKLERQALNQAPLLNHPGRGPLKSPWQAQGGRGGPGAW